MVVIPQRAQRFVDVAGGRVGGGKTRQNVWIVLIAEIANSVKIARIAITLRWVVRVVKMGGHRRHSEAANFGQRRQRVYVARHLRDPIVRLVSRAGTYRPARALGKTPDRLFRQVGRLRSLEGPLVHLVHARRWKREHGWVQFGCLVAGGADFATRGIWTNCRSLTPR